MWLWLPEKSNGGALVVVNRRKIAERGIGDDYGLSPVLRYDDGVKGANPLAALVFAVTGSQLGRHVGGNGSYVFFGGQ